VAQNKERKKLKQKTQKKLSIMHNIPRF